MSRWSRNAPAVWLAALLGLAGCARTGSRDVLPPGALPFGEPRFTEVTGRAGLIWTHHPCRRGKKYLPETMGGGGGFLDYDGDGRLDVLLVDGSPLPGYHGPGGRTCLDRNTGPPSTGLAAPRFVDVTRDAGLTFREYGMGAAAGDYDNDGWTDLFLTGVGTARLFRNDRGRFVDVSRSARVATAGWTTGAAWIDYDRDGLLDLFVARYVRWAPGADPPCGAEGARQYCPPYQYVAEPPVLYRNSGEGTFADVSARAGVLGHSGKTLSVTPCDANRDGWPDLFLANDTEPDVLLLNDRRGGFRDVGIAAGVAVGTDGRATGSMGVDVGEAFGDGRLCVTVGNFVGQGMSIFAALPDRGGEEPLFENRKEETGLGDATRPLSTFGLLFTDADLDGWPDLVALNGHLDENLAAGERREPYRQPAQCFQNRRDGTFSELSRAWAPASGVEAAPAMVGRGLALGDYDDDGRPDLLTFENGGPVRLWRNETASAGSGLTVRLVGTRSPRDGTGATVTVRTGSGTQSRLAATARSYLATSDPRLHFGLGHERVAAVTIRWPSGTVQELGNVPANRPLTATER